MTPFSGKKTSHVAVIAFPFSSHPFSTHTLVLRLARSSPNTHFTFLSFPQVNASLFNSSPHLANLTPFDIHDGVPAGQTASGLTLCHRMGFFYRAMQRPGSTKRELEKAAEALGMKFTCLLVDSMLSAFLADVAEELRVPWISLWLCTSLLLSAYLHTDAIRRHCAAAASAGGDAAVAELSLDFVPGLEGVRVSDHLYVNIFHGEFEEQSQTFMYSVSRLGQFLPRASAVVLNSFRELNPDGFNRDMEEKLRAVLNVGFFSVSFPLPPVSGDDPTGCLAWLDGREPNSVAYISFGTVAEFSEGELRIIAEALEETETSFLWSLPSEQQRLLPSGFAERTRRCRRLVAWTDQPGVLAHSSVGVHVTHCGTNSVNESVAHGVPIIHGKACTPDNQLHARMVERDWGMGVRVSEAGALTKHGLVRALQIFKKKEEWKKMKERALAMRKLAIDASSPGGSGARDFETLLGLLSALV